MHFSDANTYEAVNEEDLSDLKNKYFLSSSKLRIHGQENDIICLGKQIRLSYKYIHK